jgi:hypothetical protein
MLQEAIALVSAMEHLVMVTRKNCDLSRLAWLEDATKEVVKIFEDLRISIERIIATENDFDMLDLTA